MSDFQDFEGLVDVLAFMGPSARAAGSRLFDIYSRTDDKLDQHAAEVARLRGLLERVVVGAREGRFNISHVESCRCAGCMIVHDIRNELGER